MMILPSLLALVVSKHRCCMRPNPAYFVRWSQIRLPDPCKSTWKRSRPYFLLDQSYCQQKRAVCLAVWQTRDAILPFIDRNRLPSRAWFGPVFAASPIWGSVFFFRVCGRVIVTRWSWKTLLNISNAMIDSTLNEQLWEPAIGPAGSFAPERPSQRILSGNYLHVPYLGGSNVRSHWSDSIFLT